MRTFKEIERSIIKTYRKDIYSRFISLVKEYNLITNGDKIYLMIDGTTNAFLCAKLIQELKNHSSIKFDFEFVYNDDFLSENLNEMNIISKKVSDSFMFDNEGKIISLDSYDDVIETTLSSILDEGTYRTLLPIEKKEGYVYIRPLYLIKEIDIIRWKNYNGLAFLSPVNKNNKTKELIKCLRLNYNKTVEENIFISSTNVNLDKLLGYNVNGKIVSYLDNYDDKKR